jgi:hypothetical protein
MGNTLLTGRANRVIVIGRLSVVYGFGRAFPELPLVAALLRGTCVGGDLAVKKLEIIDESAYSFSGCVCEA